MTEVPYDEEVTRDWDWFAVDENDNVGHFATGTFRRLPPSARVDSESLEELITYFDSIPRTGECSIRPEFEKSRPFTDQKERSRYLESFVTMASRGLYSYDAELKVPGGYRGVVVPQVPLKFSALPANIQDRLARTRASVSFSTTPEISEDVTLTW